MARVLVPWPTVAKNSESGNHHRSVASRRHPGRRRRAADGPSRPAAAWVLLPDCSLMR